MTGSPFERVAAEQGDSALLFVCDHASHTLPQAYGRLGLDAAPFATHIASDIGAADVTRALAKEFGASAILARWSRLLIDLNRGADDPTLVMRLSDGCVIPDNARVDAAEIAHRVRSYHVPYHAAIAGEIAAMRNLGRIPVIISMHSFTPLWKDRRRPWQVGILRDRDKRLAVPMIEALQQAGFIVGDNEPYSGELENDCLYRHGTMTGLPHVLIEIRQDLIAEKAAAHAMAARLAPILRSALAKMGQPAIHFTRPLPATGSQTMDERTCEQLEAAVFRRLVAHLRERTDVQNIDLMTLAGFCRNCLGDWYRDAAADKGIAMEKDAARELVYGMPPSEWKRRFQKEASAEKKAAFETAAKGAAAGHQTPAQKTHG